jgi:hypothetical protein
MKVIAQRGDEYLIVPEDAEPGDNPEGVIVSGDETEEVNAAGALARGYWEEPSGDVTADELLPESFDTKADSDDPAEPGEESVDTTESDDTTESVEIKGLSDEAIESIERKYNVEVEDGS